MVLAVLILTIIIAVVLFFTEKRRKERKISNVNKQIINDNNTYVGLTTTNENNSLNIRNKKPINGFLIMLSVGVFLIILSSIIFATSTWKSYSSNLKVLMLFGETILFLLLGLVLKYVFKVTNTGNALTFISSVLLSSTFLCAGYFKLFGDDFSLTGTYSDIFLSITFLIETLALIIRMLITNNKKYIFPLICFLVSMFLLVRGVINSEIFAFTFTYIIILGINYFKDKIFDDTKAFNIFNIVLSAIFTFIYLYLCVQFNFSRILLSSLKQPSLITNSMILFDLLSLLFFGTSLVINFIKTNGRINIAALVYESFIVVCYAIFVGDLAISSFALSISGFILYVTYYLLSDDDSISKPLILLSYLQGIAGIILISFSKDFTLLMPIISLSYLILSIVSSLKEDKTKIINMIFEPIYLIAFVVGVLIQPSIIHSIKVEDAIMINSICLTVGMLISTIFNRKIKNGYFVILCLSLLIQVSFNSLIYTIFAIIINILLIAYSIIADDEFCNKSLLSVSLLLLVNIFIGLREYQLSCSIILIFAIIIFNLIYRNSNKKYLFISLACIPIIMLINCTNINYTIKDDLTCIIIIPAVIIFMRKFLNKIDEKLQLVTELFIISIISFFLSNPVFIFLYLILIYIIGYLYNSENARSSKIYFNYLMFISVILFFKILIQDTKSIFLVIVVLSEFINQLLYNGIHNKRELKFEVFHALICMLLIVLLTIFLEFSSFYVIIVGIISTISLCLLYDNERAKYLASAFTIYPIESLIDTFIGNSCVKDVLMVFIWLIPITLLLRKAIRVDDKNCNIVEIAIISYMFLITIFDINLTTGITLGMISLVLIAIGTKLKYKSYSIAGYVSLILTVLVQTFDFWSKVPWWTYILTAGIVLIVLAAVRESKKK